MQSLAPFGSYLQKQIMNGSTNEIAIILMGKRGKEIATDFQTHLPFTMYLPAGTSPYRYIWPVYHAEIYLWDTEQSSQSFIKSCVTCFMQHGAHIVHYGSKKSQYIFKEQQK